MSRPPPDYVPPGRIIGSEWAMTLTAKVAEKRSLLLIQSASCLVLHPDKIIANCGYDSFYASKRKSTPLLFRPSAPAVSAAVEHSSAVLESSTASWTPTAISIPKSNGDSTKRTPSAIVTVTTQGTGTETGTANQPVSITGDPQLIFSTSSIDEISPASTAKRARQDIRVSKSNSSSSSSSSSSSNNIQAATVIDVIPTINQPNGKSDIIEIKGEDGAVVTTPVLVDPRKRKSPIQSLSHDPTVRANAVESAIASAPLNQRTLTGSINLTDSQGESNKKKFKRSTSVSSNYISPSGDSHLGNPNRHSMRVAVPVSINLTADVAETSNSEFCLERGDGKGRGKEDITKRKFQENATVKEVGKIGKGTGRTEKLDGDDSVEKIADKDEDVEVTNDEEVETEKEAKACKPKSSSGKVSGKGCQSEYVDLTRRSPRTVKSPLSIKKEEEEKEEIKSVLALPVEFSTLSPRGSRKGPAPSTAVKPTSKANVSKAKNSTAENTLSVKAGKKAKATSSTQKDGAGTGAGIGAEGASSNKGNRRSFFKADK